MCCGKSAHTRDSRRVITAKSATLTLSGGLWSESSPAEVSGWRSHAQTGVYRAAVSVWSGLGGGGEDLTSSRSPKGSQKVTARPCMSTPQCSPTSQLLQPVLGDNTTQGLQRGVVCVCVSVVPHRETGTRSSWWESLSVSTRCWCQALRPGWSQSRPAAPRGSRRRQLCTHT